MPLTRVGLSSYIRTKMGAGKIGVELTDEQIYIAIDDAVRFYSRTKPQVCLASFSYVKGQGVYPLPADKAGIGLKAVYCPLPESSSQSIVPTNPFDRFQFTTITEQGLFDLVLNMITLEQLAQIAGQDLDWDFDPKDSKLYIYGNDLPAGEWAYEYYDRHELESVPYLDEDWFYKYALAQAKYTLGEIRSKFQQQPGNTVAPQLNGEQLKQEHEAAITELEEELRSRVGDGWMVPVVGNSN